MWGRWQTPLRARRCLQTYAFGGPRTARPASFCPLFRQVHNSKNILKDLGSHLVLQSGRRLEGRGTVNGVKACRLCQLCLQEPVLGKPGGGGGADIFYDFMNRFDGQFAETIQNRLSTRGPGGEALSLITGQESLDELRKLIIEFSQACPAKQTHLPCPFHIMGTLSHDSLASLANNLSRESCLELFQMEQDCRSQTTAPCQPPPPSAAA